MAITKTKAWDPREITVRGQDVRAMRREPVMGELQRTAVFLGRSKTATLPIPRAACCGASNHKIIFIVTVNLLLL